MAEQVDARDLGSRLERGGGSIPSKGTKFKVRLIMLSEHFVDATDDTYEKELVVDEPVFVKFGAEWCGPCKGIAPILEELAIEYAGKVKFINVDIDKTEIAQKYAIRGVPTMLFIKDGQVVNTIVGSQSKSRIQLALDTLLA